MKLNEIVVVFGIKIQKMEDGTLRPHVINRLK